MKFKENLRFLKSLMRGKVKKFVFCNCLLFFICAVSEPLIAYTYKLLIDNLSSGFSLEIVISISLLYMGVQLIGELSENLQSYFSTKTDFAIKNNILIILAEKMKIIRLEELESTSTYDLIDRVHKNITDDATKLLDNILGIISPIVTIIAYAIFLFKINIYMPFIILIASVPYLIIMMAKTKKGYEQHVSLNNAMRRQEYMIELLTDRQYAKDIRIFNLHRYMNDKLHKVRQFIAKKELWLNVKFSFFDLLGELVQYFALAVCLVISLYSVFKGDGKLGDVVFILSAIRMVITEVNDVFATISSVKSTTLYFGDWDLLDSLPNENQGEGRKLDKFDIHFKNVSFKYPKSSEEVLHDIRFSIKEGEKVAIVGENGCGKTTLVNLILGNFQASNGKILVGGHDIQESLDTLRTYVVPVLQNYMKYQFTVEDNLRAGNFGQDYEKNEMYDLGLGKFVKKLPNGFNTELGQLSPNGYELSGGEWQKLALYRAFARKESKILILDEPTASLDPIIENDIYKKITEISKEKTLIMISHRLNAVKLCDKIIVLDNGRIVEQGTHENLMKNKAKYFSLYTIQKSFYLD